MEKELFKVIIGTKTRKGNWINEIIKICSAKGYNEANNYYCQKYSPFLVEVYSVEQVPEEISDEIPKEKLPVTAQATRKKEPTYRTDVIKISWGNAGYSDFPCDKEISKKVEVIRKESARLQEEYRKSVKKETEKLHELIQAMYPHIVIDKGSVKMDFSGFTFQGVYRHGIIPVTSGE